MSRWPSFLHPNRAALVAWLDGESSVVDDITDHVDDCDRCAARLEDIAGSSESVVANDVARIRDGDDGIDDDLAEAIREVYRPPVDLNSRVMKKIDERERADRELSLFLGLFAIGKDAAELMLPPDENGPDRE